jgi:cytoskeletal protein CcmA (bactofilin family)
VVGSNGRANGTGESYIEQITAEQVTETHDEQSISEPLQANDIIDGYTSIVAADSVWIGTVEARGSVRIEGRASGEIVSHDTVNIAKGAEVDAAATAARFVIAGNYSGQLLCRERLEIKPGGIVQGAIVTRLLSVHEGAFIDGEIRMGTSN